MWRVLIAGGLGAGGLWFGVQWGPVWVALAGGGGAIVAAVVNWMLGRRRESGTVETSDAGTLWAEAREIMRDRREENARLRERVAVLERGADEDRVRIRELEDEVRRLKAIVGEGL